ncbi:MAG: hypothetical protein GWN32_18530 [Gemmatimonadetes bacterium]|nr:hypothetical protein [Gemmatimonadota bacterium]
MTLRSTDFDRTERFYRELFGWEIYRVSQSYLGFDPPAGIGGGFLKDTEVSAGNSFTLYVQVAEFEPYLTRACGLGGGSEGGIVEVPGYASYRIVTDPDGNRIGLWKWMSEATVEGAVRAAT